MHIPQTYRIVPFIDRPIADGDRPTIKAGPMKICESESESKPAARIVRY